MHHAKATSAGSTQATGSSRALLRRAFATRGALGCSNGSGVPSFRRARSTLAALALAIAAFAVTAAPASAESTEMISVSNPSYTSAVVKGKVDSASFFNSYFFQYCTVECSEAGAIWTSGPEIYIGFAEKEVEEPLAVPKGGTQYFIRLALTNGTTSPGPNPSFTTLPVDPPIVVATDDASEVFSLSAKASGKVKRPANDNAAFDVTKCRFEYVTDTDFKATGFAGAGKADCEGFTPITAPNGEQEVTAHLTGLSPSTTYHLRLAAENAAPAAATKDAASTFTTAPKVSPPTVLATDDATEVKYNSAKFTGKVLRPDGADPALDTNCHFEYVTDAQYEANELGLEPLFTGATPADCAQNTIKSTGETTVSANAGLFPETTYHLRLVAENAGGSDAMVAANTFTTPEAELPTVTIDPVEGGIFTAAHVTGTVTFGDGHGGGSKPYLQVSSDGGATWSSFEMLWSPTFGPNKGTFINGTMGGGEGIYIVKGDVTGLQPSTTYLFRIASSYNINFTTNGDPGQIPEIEARGEVGFSPEETVTTEPPQPPPTAEDLAVTDVAATTAHFSGKVDPHAPAGPLSPAGKKAFATHWEFVCTPECKDANGNVLGGGTVQGEEGAQTVTGDVKRLEPGTHYEVSLVIHSEGGDETVVETFDTDEIPPTVKQTPGASDGKAGYNLQGVVNPNNQTVTACEFKWGPDAPAYAFSADCSPMPSGGSKPITVEAHLTGLNTGVDYHALLVVKYGVDSEAKGVDQGFKATLDPPENCPANEQIRKENNSLALPECRAYEMVSPPGKEGFAARLTNFDGGSRVQYQSGAGNIAKSGQGGFVNNSYVAARSAAGWATIPNLNGPSGSLFDAPGNFQGSSYYPKRYSSDLLSSVWYPKKAGSATRNYYLRGPDGSFTLLAKGGETSAIGEFQLSQGGASDDLSHVFITSNVSTGVIPTQWGPGVYEFLGTGNEQPPRRVDVDNSGAPITTCTWGGSSSAKLEFNSSDGRVAVSRVAGGCGGDNPPATGLWARIDGTTSVNIAASECNRTVGDPGGACNDPVGSGGCSQDLSTEKGPGCRGLQFRGAASDGSRVFFTTTQQLLDADTDETTDIYACDIPSGTPAPVGDANPCSALRQVSVAETGAAAVENVLSYNALESIAYPGVSDDGSTVYFLAKGVLADNEDALGEKALAGDHNLYVWRTDAAHPAGQTTFVARLDSDDLATSPEDKPQSTPDGRYLVFGTASQLLDTDTDNARDVYRYDADTGGLTRASTNVLGVGGNGPFDAETPAISDDGQKIVFTSAEALSALDGNAESDVYLWTPARVSLISTGSVGSGGGNPAITASGQDVYFVTRGALTPADGDDLNDVYDARIGGGFSFAPAAPCTGDACQPGASNPPTPEPLGSQGTSSGNPPLPKPCPKGKVRKHGKCVKKASKKHHKSSHKKNKRANSNSGGGK
jgi:hypothetical protein